VHVEGTERIVEAVAKYDVDRYIHVSSYNADSASAAEFFATKVGQPRYDVELWILISIQGRGEEIAKRIFPETTLVRPAPMFGFEDNLLLKLAGVTNLFTANNMQERSWPVHVCSRDTPILCSSLGQNSRLTTDHRSSTLGKPWN
jgi:NADH dehydrogenase (ubiquinone) 1 alpha subcomplex subunit 9